MPGMLIPSSTSADLVTFSPSGTISATSVQAGMQEINSDATSTFLTQVSASTIYLTKSTNRTVTITSDTLVLADANNAVTYSNAAATTATVPPNSSVAFAVGTRIELMNLGAGVVTVTAGAGVTVAGTLTMAQNTGGVCVNTATNTWSFYQISASSFPASATASVATNEGTTSATFTALATAGPAVTVTTGTKALVIVSALAYNNTGGSQSLMSAAVSGATTLAATDTRAYLVEATAANIPSLGGSMATIITGLTAGSNTFTAQYRRAVGGTATFSQRNITVIDMGS